MARFNFSQLDFTHTRVSDCFHWKKCGNCEAHGEFDLYYVNGSSEIKHRCNKCVYEGFYKLTVQDIFLLRIYGKFECL